MRNDKQNFNIKYYQGKKSLPCGEEQAQSLITDPSAMIVDDNPMICEAIAMMLSNLGYSVQLTYDGSLAISNFQNSPCNLMITDYEMPELDGLQLGQRIKSQFPQTRIVIMTGLWLTAVDKKMNNPYIDAWLFKPFTIEELKNALFSIRMLPIHSQIETAL